MIPERIKKLEAYRFPEFRKDRLNLNENPFPLPEVVLSEFKERIDGDDIRLYHSPIDNAFISALTEYTGFDGKNISLVNGADEGIYFLISLFGREDFDIVSFLPSYKCYKEFSLMLGANFIEIPLSNDFSIDMERTLKLVKDRRVLFFIPNPNNPTGNLFARDKIVRILKEIRGSVVIDEAYFEFSKTTLAPLINKFNNLIILRTFSKSFSLAGERIGYLISNEDFVSHFNGFKNPYNFPYLSMVMGSIVLKHKDIFFERIQWIEAERERVFNELKKIPWLKVFPSRTNFLLLFVKDYKKLRDKLSEEKISILDLNKGWFRLSIGRRELNDKVLNVIKEVNLLK